MKKRLTAQSKLIITVLCLLVIGLACGLGQSSKPTISILTPANGQKLRADQEITVQSVSVSKEGVSRVELWVNGELIDTQTSNNPQSFTSLQPWTPAIEGTYLVEIRAFNSNDLQSDPAIVSVSVEAGSEPLSSVETPTPTPDSGPVVTAKTDLNVRAGPATDYEILAVLRSGQTATIIGMNAAETWWLIKHFDTPDGQGWVSAHPQYSTAKNADNVPVVTTAPLLEATPTTTPKPSSPLPVIHFFRADKVNISTEENVLLEWDLDGAQEAYLFPGGEAGVVAPGSLQVRPSRTTTYRLVAQNSQGEVESLVTITVSAGGD